MHTATAGSIRQSEDGRTLVLAACAGCENTLRLSLKHYRDRTDV